MTSCNNAHRSWLYFFCVLSLFVLTLACCGPEDGSSASATGAPETPGSKDYQRPANMIDALAKGTAENKIVLVELYDETCNFCLDMDRVLKKKPIVNAMSRLVHVRITVDDEGVIEHFGLTQSPSYLFFKPDGTFMAPFLDGYRPSKRFLAEIENFERRARGEPAIVLPRERHPNFEKG